MASRYTRVRKGPFTCATYEDGTQWIYVRVYHDHDEHTLGRYPTQEAAQTAYDEFRLQQALQLFPDLTPEQRQLLQHAIATHPRVAEALSRMLRNWRPIEFGVDFRHRKHSSMTRHAAVNKPIRGIRRIFLKSGEPRWRLALTHNGHMQCYRFPSLQEAEDYYREIHVQRALAPFPSLTHDQVKDLLSVRKERLLRCVVDLLINSWLHALQCKPTTTRRQRILPFQSGRPHHQRQQPTGPPPHPAITFADYARRWFSANADTWAPEGRAITRSLCTKHLVPAFGPTLVREMTSELIAQWLKEQRQHYSRRHCAHMRGRLTSILYAAVADGLIERNPATGPGCMLPLKGLTD